MDQLPVYELLKDAARRWPEKPAVYDDYGMLTFEDLYLEVVELRNRLLDLGVKQGMGVGVKARNGRNFITGIFAVIGCGAAVMPLSHQLKKTEVEDIINEAGLHVLLDDMSGGRSLTVIDSVIPMKAEFFSFSFTHIAPSSLFAPHVQMPAFIRFTSGTTGKSKGVIICHQSVIERIEAANKALDLGTDDTVIWVLPMAYHFVVSIVLYIRFGAAIAIAKNFLAKSIIEITNRYKGTLLYASPILIRLLANDTGEEQMPTLKKVISTSAAICLEICKAFKSRFNHDISQAYGIIEIGLPIINLVKSAEHPDAVGYPLPDYTVDILDDQNNPLPNGSIGHLGIKGPGMFDAYLIPQTLRDAVLKNGYFLTADYACKSADGLIKIMGRTKSVINVSGIKVFPEEVEAVLETIPEIKLARISSSPHPLMGQIIEGELVLNEGETIDVEDVLLYCRKRLSAFKAPQRLRIVDELTMTCTGKIQRF
ncbi:MAG: acyl--CoA ligase [Ferruginibacter sp.]|nr:acyl--CoA ligase [Ferruginibacter sp.]